MILGWTQTKGPYVEWLVPCTRHQKEHSLLEQGKAVSSARLMAVETWVAASKGLRRYQDGTFYILPGVSAFTQKGNALYAGTNGDLFYSTNNGDSWQQLTHYQRDWGISGVVFIGDTIYIGRYEQRVFSFQMITVSRGNKLITV